MPDDRYTMREEDDGTWSVVDFLINIPVALNNVRLVGLEMHEADDLVEHMNAIERKRRSEIK